MATCCVLNIIGPADFAAKSDSKSNTPILHHGGAHARTTVTAIGRADIRVRHAAAGVVIVPWLELALRYEPRSSESVLLWPDSRVGAHRHLPLGAATEVHHDAGDQRIWAWRRFTLKECSRQSRVCQSKLEGHPACCRTPDAHRPMPNGHDPVAGAGISNPSPCRRRRRHRG